MKTFSTADFRVSERRPTTPVTGPEERTPIDIHASRRPPAPTRSKIGNQKPKMIQDLRFALRLLAKSPGFTALALLSLAAAIGVNSGIFSLVDAAFLRSFIPHAAEKVNLFTAKKDAERDFRQFSYAEFTALAEPNDVFTDLGAAEYSSVGIGLGETIRRSIAFLVSDGYFRVHEAQAAQGRSFTAEESRAGAAIPVAVLSDTLWRRLGQQPDIVGSPLRVNGQVFTVVGVKPRTFSGGNAFLGPELWLPLGARDLITSSVDTKHDGLPLDHPRAFELNLLGRLKPGLTLESAMARLTALTARLDAVKADAAAGPRTLLLQHLPRFSLNTNPSQEDGAGTYAVLLLALAGAVLLIACLNLANLMLARGSARSREFAVRAAVGATRWAIVRQLLIEGLLLSVGGGALGLFVATWANELLLDSMAQLLSTLHFSIVLPLAPDLRAVSATFGFCTLATLLFALVPALRYSRPDVARDLKQQGNEGRDHHALSRFFAPRQVLVMAQLALALMLLFSAGLFFRAARAAAGVAPGFDPRGGLVAEYDYSLLNLAPPTMRQRTQEAIARVAAVPGVAHAAVATLVPFGPMSDGRGLSAVGGALGKDGKPVVAEGLFTSVSEDYFATIGVPILRGREFSAPEVADPDSRVAIIDETMAAKLFPGRDALGQHVQLSNPEKDGTELEVVAIVAAHRHDILARTPPERLYLPFARGFDGAAFLHVRMSNTESAALTAAAPAVRTALRRGDPLFPLLALRSFADIVASNLGLWVVRLGALLFGAFGLIALLLAIAGVYGVKAYAVERRQREIGIRMAVGAQPGDVLRLFLAQGLRQIGVGLGAGLLLALAVGQAVSAMLYRVSPFDPLVLGSAVAVLAATAVLATWIPARRATRVDPCGVLRAD